MRIFLFLLLDSASFSCCWLWQHYRLSFFSPPSLWHTLSLYLSNDPAHLFSSHPYTILYMYLLFSPARHSFISIWIFFCAAHIPRTFQIDFNPEFLLIVSRDLLERDNSGVVSSWFGDWIKSSEGVLDSNALWFMLITAKILKQHPVPPARSPYNIQIESWVRCSTHPTMN